MSGCACGKAGPSWYHTREHELEDTIQSLTEERDLLKRREQATRDLLKMGTDETLARLVTTTEERDTLRAALERGPSWNDWLAWMDHHYPADAAYFAESDDHGPRAVRAFRAALIGEPT